MGKLMNGNYYEITAGMSEDIIKRVPATPNNDKKAKQIAIDTERIAYRNTYVNGKRTESVKLWDPYGDGFYLVGTDNLYYEPLSRDKAFEYQMLARLRADCEYFLGNGGRCEKYLWAGNIADHIKEMRNRWEGFADDEKPEWLTKEQIDDYERRMTA